MDRAVKKVLQQYVQVFREGRERNINEADTVMYLVKFFTDALGYDVFHELTKEFQVRERYCDLAVKLDGVVHYLVEAKAATHALSDRHIEQAESYAARSGIPWVVLTNGINWRLYHLTFDNTTGIEHDLAFECSLTAEADLEETWKLLELLSRTSVKDGTLDAFWERKKTLSAGSLIEALFTEEVLHVLRRELHRRSEVRLELEDIAAELRRLLNPDVLTEDIKIHKSRKKRRKTPREESPAGGIADGTGDPPSGSAPQESLPNDDGPGEAQ